MIVSRLGVMFFGDPVRRFAICGARRVTRRAPFCYVAKRCRKSVRGDGRSVPRAPLCRTTARQAGRVGQVAADRHLGPRHSEESGWAGITIRPIDVTCTFPEKDMAQCDSAGPLGLVLHGG